MSATVEQEIRVLHTEAHKQFIKNHDKDKAEDFGYWLFEHLQVSGFYWGLSAMALLSALEEMPKDEILDFVSKCFDESSGGFGGSIGHDPHLLYTLSAVQVYALFESLDMLNKDAIAKFVASMQKDDGSFSGDEWGEIDTRFSYIALNCLSLLGRLDAIDMDKAVDFVVKCINFDGGFGVIPGAESHAGQTFCCVGALAIAGKLDRIDLDLLGWWLCERQLPNGGLNGRPQKLPDVCYSWWVLSCLGAIDRLHWMSCPKLTEFILDCQDPDRGGISDRPDDRTDVYHTFFGLSGLSLMGYKGLVKIDPVYALPAPLTQKLGLQNAKIV